MYNLTWETVECKDGKLVWDEQAMETVNKDFIKNVDKEEE